MKHPVLDFLLVSAACELNDKDNRKMLANGQYIPWWKRHLLLTIGLVFLAPVLVIGAFIIFANVVNPSPATVMTAMRVLLYTSGVVFCVVVVVAYRRAEKRWNREANKPTKVIDVKRW
jgi:hypothetical protein